MPRISLRKVHIDGQEWKWYVRGWSASKPKNGDNLVIFDFEKKRYEIEKNVFSHLMNKVVSYRPEMGSLPPGDVVTFIRTFILPLQVVDVGENISMMMTDGFIEFAVADMDRMEDHWWFSRLHVKDHWQRKGYGSWLVDRLKNLARGKPIFVVHGGYDFPREAQVAFYISCGFVEQTEGRFAGGMLYVEKRKG